MKKYLLLIISMIVLMSCTKKITSVIKNENADLSIRVMSYNIHHCNPPSKPDFIDLDAVANTISKQNPDVVALQEVDVNTIRSGKINQAAILAEKLKMNVVFAKAIDYEGGEYGVAILSKYPISKTEIHRLTTQPDTKGEPRVMLTAILALPNGKKIRFGCTHFDAQKAETNRLLQAREINSIAMKEKLPFVIAGDLNSRPGSNTINILDEQYTRTCQDCEFTIPVINPKSTIDFIAYSKTSPFMVLSHQVVAERYASDHLPVVATLSLKTSM